MFKTYGEAYKYARKQASEMPNFDFGLERNKHMNTFAVFMLPAPEYRRGHELRCQVVVPDRPGPRHHFVR